MIYLKCFESYNIEYKEQKNDTENYYFNTNKFEYKISIHKAFDGLLWFRF
jgi:hypothetical protein